MQAQIESLYYGAIINYCLKGLSLDKAVTAANYGINIGMGWLLYRLPYVVNYN